MTQASSTPRLPACQDGGQAALWTHLQVIASLVRLLLDTELHMSSAQNHLNLHIVRSCAWQQGQMLWSPD